MGVRRAGACRGGQIAPGRRQGHRRHGRPMTAAQAIGARRRLRGVPYTLLVAALAILVVILFILSLAVGYAPLDLGQAFRDLLRGEQTVAGLVLVELRVPRALLGALVGFSLGVSGAAMQGLMRNPLAEPGIIGVSGTAALGAVTIFYFGFAGAMTLALPLGGIAGAAVATFLLSPL